MSRYIPYWPWCERCKQPFEFEDDEPFAYCGCFGSTEWGDPRPYPWVTPPGGISQKQLTEIKDCVCENRATLEVWMVMICAFFLIIMGLVILCMT